MSEGQRDAKQELLRRFTAAVSGAELDDLRRLAGRLLDEHGAGVRRRPRRDVPVTLRVRVDLDGAAPPIWRRFDLRSDLTLDLVHEVLQAGYGWHGGHLHRFAIGESVFADDAEKFLCAWEVEDGADEGVVETAVRLDETLVEVGDQLRYCYDYGDAWVLVLTLEAVLPADGETPHALCLDGERAAPPEDCGGLRTAEELAAVLAEPAHFSRTEVNALLTGPYGELAGAGVRPELLELLARLQSTPVGEELAVRAWGLSVRTPAAAAHERAEALLPFHWFLERIGDAGLPLTAAGYLKPVDVTAAAQVVPGGRTWRGARNREVDTLPVMDFRAQLHVLGLVRAHQGRLVATRAGRALRGDDDRLWAHLADRLPLGNDRDGSSAAGLVALLLLASSPHPRVLALDTVAEALTALGWREGNSDRPIPLATARHAVEPTLGALEALSGGAANVAGAGPLSAVAADLAALALLAP